MSNEPRATAMHNRAFTLIELSIVLVIIGLVVGGVLVGKDLIAAATIRKAISQKEQVDTAVQTFRLKYNCLAGDCVNAEQFGFKARGTARGQGDGNGLIEGSGPAQGNAFSLDFVGGETLLFWTDIIDAGFFANKKLTRPTASSSCGNVNTPSLSDCLPVANINSQMFWLSYSYQGENFLTLQKVKDIYAWGNINTQNDVPGLSAAQAFSIDTKLDDGYPLTGSVKAKYINYYINQARPIFAGGIHPNEGASTTAATAATANSCYDNANTAGAPQQYSMSDTTNANLNCALTFTMK